jgi:mono/diheme cytochrome c family protein
LCIAEFDVLALTVQIMFPEIYPMTIPRCPRLGFPVLMAFGLALLNSGCGTGPQAEFKFRETTEDLIPEANKTVKKTLKDSFGTPVELVAWQRFPVDYGGVKGTVTSTDGAISVSMDGNAGKIVKGAPLVWLTGALAGEKSVETSVASFDPAENHLSLADGAGTPVTGDQFIVGYGDGLQMGRVVYMKNCMHCHGVTGDGAGPTGQFLNPRPRDYRKGVFKFTSTQPGEKASRNDLHRVVQYGIPGTYMPSFLLLGDRETKAVVEYVRWLAIRGEFEKRLVEELASDYSKSAIEDANTKEQNAYKIKQKNKEEAEKPASLPKAIKAAGDGFKKYVTDNEYSSAIDETANLLAEAWAHAEESETVVNPSVQRVNDTPESRERGRLLYMSDKTKCYTCHGPTGRGDGSSTEDFWDVPGTQKKYEKRGLHDEWGNPLKPRNLTLGQYRGGRRPIDLFRRMFTGIKGTPMPKFGGALKDAEIWDIVNYVMSLPYQETTPAKISQEHIVKSEEKAAH